MAGFIGCSRNTVVRTYEKWLRKDNQWTGDSVMGAQCILMLIIAKVVNIGYDRNVSEHSASQLTVYGAA